MGNTSAVRRWSAENKIDLRKERAGYSKNG
jgi:hypothetical protein